MKTKIKHVLRGVILLYLLTNFTSSDAQIVDDTNKLSLTLSDGTQVMLYGEASSLSDRKSKNYYYLPVSLRLGAKPDTTPEFLFLKYITEEKEEDGGIGGALLHMLMEWGLTPSQQKEVEKILANGEQGALKKSKLKGALDVKPDGDKSLRIISATLSDDKLAPSVVQSLSAPVLPGAKVAVASNLSANGAQLLAATFEKTRSITDLSIEMGFKYTTRIPAAKGRVIVRWSEVQKHMERDYAQYKEVHGKKSRGGLFGGVADALFGKKTEVKSRSYDEVRSVIDQMIENEYIKVDFDENISDDRVTKIREAFFDFFLQKMTESGDSDVLAPPTEKEKAAMPNIKYGKKYTYNRRFFESSFKKKTETYYLNYRLAVEKPFTLTANLASWYDGVKNNKKCVGTVLMNDKFFTHRDINMILDLQAKEMFDKEINYVTVNVRKKRSSGNDFNDSRTIDSEFLKKNGLKATISYARGDDKNSEVYEYKTQWSIRGGNVFPKDPQWIKGDWQGVTLEPPIVPRTIEFEADLDELSSLGVVRATLLLRYYRFGEEVETNVPLTVSKGEPLIEQMIFTDRNTQGYAYQLVLTHKEKGKMALGWDDKINDDYIYATIPQELRDDDPDYLEKIIEAGKIILKPGADGKVSKEATILDKFKDVIGVVKN
ncbi:hypothetical protein EV195_10894 [Tenacibaculum skagerrakense]|uniref:Uncharacterized protein n=1 Tax=Tenacibaculum skagerrakense TaxID=186571 RepID=A0A4R2NQF9_9FLAO|nr:hypothetical protein [Tenacibaculum skagerrakense]TCP23624.1 hypothetical protein EV195_10894 [Tenacibaculum skagerrakense]